MRAEECDAREGGARRRVRLGGEVEGVDETKSSLGSIMRIAGAIVNEVAGTVEEE